MHVLCYSSSWQYSMAFGPCACFHMFKTCKHGMPVTYTNMIVLSAQLHTYLLLFWFSAKQHVEVLQRLCSETSMVQSMSSSPDA